MLDNVRHGLLDINIGNMFLHKLTDRFNGFLRDAFCQSYITLEKRIDESKHSAPLVVEPENPLDV